MQQRELSDTQWQKLKPLLPPEKPPVGRPSKPHRPIMEAIVWHLRTGAPWRETPEKYGPWETVYSRFRKWVDDGTWERVYDELQSIADEQGELDWMVHHVDGTSVRVHQHGTGAQKKTANKQSGRAAGA